MMTEYTFEENIVSDLHKDARGFRPSELWRERWTLASNDRKQQIWDGLIEEFNQAMEEEKRQKARRMLAFVERIGQMYELGATSETQAIKWILEGEEFSEWDLEYGVDFVAYHFGLDYTEARKFPIQVAINEMLALVQ